MTHLRKHIQGRWATPLLSGVLIAISLAAQWVFGYETLGDIVMVAGAAVGARPIVVNAVRALANRVIGIDLLVSVAAIGAVVIGEYWEAAAVTFLFAFGHALESATLNRTRAALAALVEVAPDVAIVMRDGEQVEVPAGSIAIGETVLVKNGAKVPVDGIVLAGTASLDEASITGESMPAEKFVSDRVYAGTVSLGGFIQVRATGVGADTTLARIIHRVEEAQDAKAATARFMDRFAVWYTPAIMIGAVVAGLVSGDVALALTLLVIGCPGALVISIPVSIVAGIGRAARDGILIKGGEFLESSARIDTVALDKTGTLTEGRPKLTDVVVLTSDRGADHDADRGADRGRDRGRDEVLRWAAAAEAGSEHPLARAVLDAAEDAGLGAIGLPEHTEPVPGKGIAATVQGRRVLVGNAALLDHFAVVDRVGAAQAADRLAAAGQTPMIVAVDDVPVGVIAVADTLRADAVAMIQRLHDAGVDKVVMLTGDAPAVAEAIAGVVGIDEVYAGLLPEDKLDVVRALQGEGRTVAMVGDGVNDAPALAAADVGVAMGAAGSAVAVETADIALMGDNLLKLPAAVTLSRRTVNTMRQNIAVAMVTVTLLLAGVLFGGVTMAIGMLVHELSVLAVIANAMRLLRRRETTATGVAVVPVGSTRSSVEDRAATTVDGDARHELAA